MSIWSFVVVCLWFVVVCWWFVVICWWFVVVCWWFVTVCWWLVIVCARLCLFVVVLVVACFSKAKINNTLVSGNEGDEKIFTREAANFFYQLNWILLKNKEPIFYFLKGKKRKFVRINLLVQFFCVCVFFLKHKIYILIHILLIRAGRW